MSQLSTNPVKKELKPRPNHKYNRDKDREMVKGIFRFFECPGGTMSFSFKKYKEDPVERFDLVDGQVHNIPLGVAKHLNTNCWYPEYGFIQGEKDVVGGYSPEGKIMRITKKVRRCAFQSLEFLDIEDLPSAPGQEIVNVDMI